MTIPACTIPRVIIADRRHADRVRRGQTIAAHLYGPRCDAAVHDIAAECDHCAPVLIDGWPASIAPDPYPPADIAIAMLYDAVDDRIAADQ